MGSGCPVRVVGVGVGLGWLIGVRWVGLVWVEMGWKGLVRDRGGIWLGLSGDWLVVK